MSKVGNPLALTMEQVATIRVKLDKTNLRDFADDFGCSDMTVRNAALGNPPYDKLLDPKPLKKIPRQEFRRNERVASLFQNVKAYRKQLQDSDEFRAKEAKRLKVNSDGTNAIASAKFGISESYVSRICNGHYDK